MQPVTVEKKRLIETVGKNLEGHRKEFLEAQERYRELCIELLDEALANARKGKEFSKMIHLPMPEDHSGDYSAALSMLEMSVDETVEIDEQAFRELVLNQWYWLASYHKNTQIYTSGQYAKKK